MPFQPSYRDVHIDVPLTNVSVAYLQEEEDFVASKLTKAIPVNFQSNTIATYSKEYWFRDEAQLRAPGTETAGSGWGISRTAYATEQFGFHKDVADEDRANADMPFNLDNEAREYVMQKLLIKRDVLLAAAIFGTSIWATDKTLTYTLDDYGSSDLFTAVEDARDGVHSVTGKNVNRALMGRQVWRQLKHHPQLLDRIKWTQRGQLTVDLVASLLEIDRIIIGESIKASAVEGATATYSYIYGKHMLFMYQAPSPSLLTPSAFYSFVWKGVDGVPVLMRRLRNDWKKFDRIEGMFNIDHKVIATDCGYFINGAGA